MATDPGIQRRLQARKGNRRVPLGSHDRRPDDEVYLGPQQRNPLDRQRLTPLQARVLGAVLHIIEQSIAEIARSCGMSKSRALAALQSLVSKGYVRRIVLQRPRYMVLWAR